jgi:BlaI family transcriptional regulator, penicillinase repressor
MSTQKPTEGELAILRVLWARGPSTVREVVAELPGEVGYTTALKLMQIMFEKGLVQRDESARSHVYRPAVSEEKTLRQLAGDLLDRAFGGSTQKLVMSALSAAKASPEELREIRALLEAIETKKGGK